MGLALAGDRTRTAGAADDNRAGSRCARPAGAAESGRVELRSGACGLQPSQDLRLLPFHAGYFCRLGEADEEHPSREWLAAIGYRRPGGEWRWPPSSACVLFATA